MKTKKVNLVHVDQSHLAKYPMYMIRHSVGVDTDPVDGIGAKMSHCSLQIIHIKYFFFFKGMLHPYMIILSLSTCALSAPLQFFSAAKLEQVTALLCLRWSSPYVSSKGGQVQDTPHSKQV